MASAESPLALLAAELLRDYDGMMTSFNVQGAAGRLGAFLTACNGYIETTAPWKLAKDLERANELNDVLSALAEALRIAAILIAPVMPKSAASIFEQLNWAGELKLDSAKWGAFPDGHRLGMPTPLFPRIEG